MNFGPCALAALAVLALVGFALFVMLKWRTRRHVAMFATCAVALMALEYGMNNVSLNGTMAFQLVDCGTASAHAAELPRLSAQ